MHFTIDTGAGRHPISPYVYGVNQADWAGRSRAMRFGRLGGNRWTAYNWETNASNAGTDYFNQNDDYLGGGDTPGEAVRPYVAQAHAVGASVLVTVPTAGYVSADKNGGGDVSRTPDYLETRFLKTAIRGRGHAGPPDRGDRVVYLDEFVAFLEGAFPGARHDPSRTIFYGLDNEPDLWAFTHPRIRPAGKVTYEELLSRTLEVASAIKATAPGALIFGPASYGWAGYQRLQDAPDAGGRDFLDFYLSSLRAAERTSGRLIDVLDLHWYPEAKGGGVRITENNDSAPVAAARVQAPRSLWDPTYVETSWISQDAGVGAIRLIPRLREKIAAAYPGTQLAFTEYSYGGGRHISGALATADALGIFGREGVFAASLWGSDAETTFFHAAFNAFVNYDGQGGRFGDVSVSAVTSNHVITSVYASVDEDSDARVVIVALNKSPGRVNVEIALRHPAPLRQGRTYQVTSASAVLSPGPLPSFAENNLLRIRLDPWSITTLVLSP
ncbi:MAG TPA: glycoside hydrolase family 44 protein [Vicinamibacteria bacterium]